MGIRVHGGAGLKVLLCGEGVHDVGRIEHWSIREAKKVTQPGWLQAVLLKALGPDTEFIVVPRSRLVSFSGAGQPRHNPRGHGAKAQIAKYRAISEGCDVVVFMIDADTADENGWAEKRNQVIVGFETINSEVKSVACIPMSASESWLLSDSEAWRELGLEDTDALPSHPERIWGSRQDPNSSHPHCLFRKICNIAGVADSRETRVALMDASSIDRLRESCPTSFVAFMADLAA